MADIADEFGRKSFNETKQNINKVKDKIIDTHNRNTAKKTTEATKRISNKIKGTIKTNQSYSVCVTAVDWFNEKHQYMPRDSSYIPKCGDIIFF